MAAKIHMAIRTRETKAAHGVLTIDCCWRHPVDKELNDIGVPVLAATISAVLLPCVCTSSSQATNVMSGDETNVDGVQDSRRYKDRERRGS